MVDKEQVIVEVTYDTTEAQKNVDELTQGIVELENANKDLKDQLKQGKISQEDYSKALESNKLSMQKNKAERKDNIKFIKAEANSIDALRARNAQITKTRNKLTTATKEGRLAIAKLNKEYDKNNKTIKENSNANEKLKGNVGNYKSALDGLPGSLGGATSGMMGLVKASLAFIATPIGAIIALLVLAFKALTSYFNSSEEGQGALNKVMKVFGVIMDNLIDVVSDLGKKIFEMIQNPQQALKDFGKLVKDNIVNRFVGLLELIPNLGKAVKLMFEGDFKEAGKVAVDALAKVTLGVEDITDKTNDAINKLGEYIDEQKREMSIADKLAERENALIKARREQGVQVAKNSKEIQDLLLSYRDETNSAEERREMVRKANDIKREELEINKNLALENYNIIKSQNALSKSTIEDKQKEADALTAFYNIQAQNSAQLRELKNRENELDRKIATEQKAERKAQSDQTDSIIKDMEAEIEAKEEMSEIDAEAHAEIMAQIREEDAARDQQAAAQALRTQTIVDAYLTIAAASAKFITGEIKSFGEFFKILANSLIDQVTAVVLAQNAIILARSLASWESIATGGALGAIKAAGIIALTTGASTAAKASIQSLDDGGQVKMGTFGGNYHSQGGNNLYDRSGRLIANVERDENFYVMKRDASAHINALSAHNESFGGRSFTSGNVAHAANGGQIPTTQPVGLTAQDVQSVISQTPIVVRVTDITAGITERDSALNAGVV